MNIYPHTGPRVLHSPLTNCTLLVLCVRITLEYCVPLTIDLMFIFKQQCEVLSPYAKPRLHLVESDAASTLYYHVKPQPHHVKLQSGWVKHYSYHAARQIFAAFGLV